MPQVSELSWPVFLLAAVLLFVAVAAGTYLGLTIAFPADAPLHFEIQCFPEHAIMPEDLGRPDREWEAMGCR